MSKYTFTSGSGDNITEHGSGWKDSEPKLGWFTVDNETNNPPTRNGVVK